MFKTKSIPVFRKSSLDKKHQDDYVNIKIPNLDLKKINNNVMKLDTLPDKQ